MFLDTEVVRYKDGVTNRPQGDIFNSLRQPDPTIYHQYYNDFDRFVVAEWLVVNPNGGAGTGVLNPNLDGGSVQLNSDAGGGNDAGIYKLGRGFLMEVGKRAFFRCRCRVDEATLSRVIVGIQNPTAQEPETPVDGIYFRKEPGDTSFSLVVDKDGTEATPPGGEENLAIADNTFFEWAFFYDGVSRVYSGFDGVAVGFNEPGTSFPDDEVLTPMAFISNGITAQNMLLDVDYLFMAKER